MKDFFIKIRLFKDSFSKSSEHPQQASGCMERGTGPEGGLGLREGGAQAPGFLSPSC